MLGAETCCTWVDQPIGGRLTRSNAKTGAGRIRPRLCNMLLPPTLLPYNRYRVQRSTAAQEISVPDPQIGVRSAHRGLLRRVTWLAH